MMRPDFVSIHSSRGKFAKGASTFHEKIAQKDIFPILDIVLKHEVTTKKLFLILLCDTANCFR